MMRPGTYYRLLLLEYLGYLSPCRRVLDVGCHDPTILEHVSSELAVGVDPSPEKGTGVAVIPADGTALPFAAGVFDRVYAIEVLEHVVNPRQLVEELHRVVKPGGEIIVTSPHESLRVFPGFLTPLVHRLWGHHRGFRGFSESDIRGLLAVGPPVRLSTWPGKAYLVFYLPMRLLYGFLGERLGRKLVGFIFHLDRVLSDRKRGRIYLWLAKLVKRQG